MSLLGVEIIERDYIPEGKAYLVQPGIIVTAQKGEKEIRTSS